ncbi:Translation elongation factor P Lys34--(R)-beta-lysine ligase [hydrothermal vent metagenome]|uniref:Translation elongation factor P Lys34--(R)-beta-lysine ligase n=1 Tax=hydrothermal vent metagenome TaxID=652676 RepID=A0A3B0YMB8_9ZZZZ
MIPVPANTSAVPKTDQQTDWRPGASREVLQMRAMLMGRIRDFFREQGVLEVDTPTLSSSATTDPAIESLQTRYTGPEAADGKALYLQSSPEFFMKRLLATGCGPIYQLAHVFRDGEYGARHNPEFMMLEWYRPGFNHHQLMDEIDALLVEVLAGLVDYQPARRISYRDWFIENTGLDPWIDEIVAFQQFAEKNLEGSLPGLDEEGLDAWLDLLVTHWLEPRLDASALFVFDYPPSQASLARLRGDGHPVAERFELYFGAVELANGFHELSDSAEQQQRFMEENIQRTKRGKKEMPMDKALIAALSHGLPDCSGVAIGFDRLLMVAAGETRIDAVMPFGLERV